MDLWNRPGGQNLAIGFIGSQFPSVIISAEAAAKMEALVAVCPIEVSWFCTADREGPNFRIDDVFIPPQECSAGSTVFRDASLHTPLMDKDGRIPRDKYPLVQRMRAWGHSHHFMGTGQSGTDDKQSRYFINNMPNDYFIRLICNKRGELNVTLYLLDRRLVLYHPKIINEKPLKGSDLETMLELDDFPFDTWAEEMIEQKVNAFRLVYESDEEDAEPSGIEYYSPELYRETVNPETAEAKVFQ